MTCSPIVCWDPVHRIVSTHMRAADFFTSYSPPKKNKRARGQDKIDGLHNFMQPPSFTCVTWRSLLSALLFTRTKVRSRDLSKNLSTTKIYKNVLAVAYGYKRRDLTINFEQHKHRSKVFAKLPTLHAHRHNFG